MRHTFAVAVLTAALTLSACKDSSGPAALSLTEAQAEDMMEALASVGAATSLSQRAAEYRQGPTVQLATITLDESQPCPGGGTNRTQGTVTSNDAGTQLSASLTQSYSACKATSPNGVLWTFNGAPNLKFDFSMSVNETTANYTMNGTQKGAIDAASSIGSGRCVIDLTFTASGNLQTSTGTATVSGTMCGRTISMTVTE